MEGEGGENQETLVVLHAITLHTIEEDLEQLRHWWTRTTVLDEEDVIATCDVNLLERKSCGRQCINDDISADNHSE